MCYFYLDLLQPQARGVTIFDYSFGHQLSIAPHLNQSIKPLTFWRVHDTAFLQDLSYRTTSMYFIELLIVSILNTNSIKLVIVLFSFCTFGLYWALYPFVMTMNVSQRPTFRPPTALLLEKSNDYKWKYYFLLANSQETVNCLVLRFYR